LIPGSGPAGEHGQAGAPDSLAVADTSPAGQERIASMYITGQYARGRYETRVKLEM
jgi:hypothetical protein